MAATDPTRGQTRRQPMQTQPLTEDSPPSCRIGTLRVVENSPLLAERPPINDEEELAFHRLPPLRPATGAPIKIEGRVGGAQLINEHDDPRLKAMSMGFPISIHPLRVSNARAQFSSASSHSIIDFRFVRLAGLLHQMIPLRSRVDTVKLTPIYGGSPLHVLGYVNVLFDALGFEFKQKCWVTDIDLPFDIQLGIDWVEAYDIDFRPGSGTGNIVITNADAKKARGLEDVYVTV